MTRRTDGLKYRAGGNPPINPGLFLDGERIAWWPAGRLPTQRDASLVLAAYESYGRALNPDEVRAAINPEEENPA